MSKPTTGQFQAVIETLSSNVNWDVLDHIALKKIVDDPITAGKQFTAFLKNGGKIIVGEPKVIPVDRTVPFDPATFIGAGWVIVEQDERSLALNWIDLTEVMFETTLDKEEKYVKGEYKLKRLKAMDRIRLDAGIFKTLWDNQHLIPLKWREQTKGDITSIFFDGTVLQNSDGHRYIMLLFWRNGEWHWGNQWLTYDLCVYNQSAVLASKTKPFKPHDLI